jgi:hypothetical protein
MGYPFPVFMLMECISNQYAKPENPLSVQYYSKNIFAAKLADDDRRCYVNRC